MEFIPVGDCALTVKLAGGRCAPDAATLSSALLAAAPRGVVDVFPAFGAVTVTYDVAELPVVADVVGWLARWIEGVSLACGGSAPAVDARVVELGVRYGGAEDGPDLAELARAVGMSEELVIRDHAGGEYTVAAVGFLPGFAYLSGLAKRLQVPRRATPRVRVPAGSVAIGGPYTGVYPVASPGGWHIIGRTDARLFDPSKPDGTPFRVGDRVRFVAERFGC